MEWMVDLETLSTRSDAAIISIGLVAFDMNHGITNRMKWNTIPDPGSHMDYETIMWWFNQSSAAQASVYSNPVPMRLVDAIFEMNSCIHHIGKPTAIWSHGSDFDLVLLKNACLRLDIECPWDRRMVRDTRTLFSLTGVEIEKTGVQHDALDDAIAQTNAVIKARKLLENANFALKQKLGTL